MTDDRRDRAPQSVTRVIGILEALCTGPLGLAELGRLLSSPKSSVAALLRGLAAEGLVVAADGAYRLGPAAFGLGSALSEARRRVHSSELVRAGMRRLAARSGETVLFAVRDGAGPTMTYVDVVESEAAVRFTVAIGDRRLLWCTAGGRMLLAVEPEAGVRRYLDGLAPVPPTAQAEIDPDALAGAIAAARRDGVAQTVDQAAEGVTGTAALVREAGGLVLGALIVAAPTARLGDGRAALAGLVRAEAAVISHSLGHRG